jgi:hypothetical protein
MDTLKKVAEIADDEAKLKWAQHFIIRGLEGILVRVTAFKYL